MNNNASNNVHSNNESIVGIFTCQQCLQALDVPAGHRIWNFFLDEGLLWEEVTNQWYNPPIFEALKLFYRTKLFKSHPDQGGTSATTEEFQRCKQAWQMLKSLHVSPVVIDLTFDSGSDDDNGNDDEDMAQDAIYRSILEKKLWYEHYYMGCSVTCNFNFFGEITNIRVEPATFGEIPAPIFHAVYRDGDTEDLTLYELQCTEKDEDCDISVGNVGYTFLKEFTLEGLVTEVHYIDPREGK